LQSLEIGTLKTTSITNTTVLFGIQHDPEFFERAIRKLDNFSSTGAPAVAEPYNVEQKQIQIPKMYLKN
jgi:hypothetical protein